MKGKRGFQKGNTAARNRGKNKKTLKREELRAHMEKRIAERWDDLVNAQMDLALGCKVLKKLPTGKEFVYKKLPDTRVIEYMQNQTIGKPQERHQVEANVRILDDLDKISE